MGDIGYQADGFSIDKTKPFIRMNDKVNRLMSVTKQGINLVSTETLRDTLIDLHNYSAMAITLVDMNETLEHPRVTQIKNDSKKNYNNKFN